MATVPNTTQPGAVQPAGLTPRVDEFELMRRRIQGQGAQAGDAQQRQIQRQFASLGNLDSGVAFNLQQQAAQQNQRNTDQAIQDVNVAQAQTNADKEMQKYGVDAQERMAKMNLDQQKELATWDRDLKQQGMDLQKMLRIDQNNQYESQMKLDKFATFINSMEPLKAAGFSNDFIVDMMDMAGLGGEKDTLLRALNSRDANWYADQAAQAGAAKPKTNEEKLTRTLQRAPQNIVNTMSQLPVYTPVGAAGKAMKKLGF